MWVWIWLAVVVLSLIIEFITFELVTIWFSLGGLIALILAACGVGPEIHIVVFSVVSLAFLLGFRNIALKYLLKNKADTNTDLIINKSYKLLTAIKKDSMGTIKINGVTWNVTTSDDSEIEEGKRVVTVEIQGNKMIVKLDEQTTKEEVKEVKAEQPPKEVTKAKTLANTTKATTQKATTKTSAQAKTTVKKVPAKATATVKKTPTKAAVVVKKTSTKGDKK